MTKQLGIFFRFPTQWSKEDQMQLLNFLQRRVFSFRAGKDFAFIHTDQPERKETNVSYKRVCQPVLSCST